MDKSEIDITYSLTLYVIGCSTLNIEFPLVSVILCNYNYERFIAEAIDSVLCQTYDNFELIIVDDGSTDNSRDVIRSYSDQRIHFITQKNQGQAAAFNAGFNSSKGEIICFLDSDDYWMPDKIAMVVDVFKQGNYSIVQHNKYVINADSDLTGAIHPNVYFNGDALECYFSDNHVGFFCTTSGIACRRKDIELIFPLDVSWRICADVPITRALPLFGKVFTFDRPLGFYRIHDVNNWMMSEEQKDWIANQLKYTEYTNSILTKFGIYRKIDFYRSKIYRRWKMKQRFSYLLKSLWVYFNFPMRFIIPTNLRQWVKRYLNHSDNRNINE